MLEQFERVRQRFDQVLEQVQQAPAVRPEPVPLGAFITQVAQLKIHQSRLRAAKTAEEREAIRKQALESFK